MIKNVSVVSLSSGVLGEPFVSHELEIGLSRLQAYGLNVTFMPHALSGLDFVKAHPECRARDLISAFADPRTEMILCAIGGDDTYRLLPYLFDADALASVISNKIFLGFSDSTVNHLMLHKLGLNTFYGQAFLPDICELAPEMLPYSRHYFEELITTGTVSEIRPSDCWLESRTDFSPSAINTSCPSHPNTGFELLQGAPVFSGSILGGCIETLFDIFDSSRYPDSASLCSAYALFPSLSDWTGKILLLETSEEESSPAHYRQMLETLKRTGVFSAVSGVLCGKPINEKYFSEYKKIITDVIADPSLPVVANVNVGHATPRCIIPFGVPAMVDVTQQVITFKKS